MVEIKAEAADVTLSSLKNDVDKILTMLGPVKNDVDKIKTAFKELLERLDDLTMKDSSPIIVTDDYWCIYYTGSFENMLKVLKKAFVRYMTKNQPNYLKLADMRVKMSKMTFPSTS